MNYLTRLGSIALCAVSFAVAGCQTTTTNSHQFSQPSAGWTTKTGQLAYKDQKLSLIGEVLVRYSKQGDFELTFTKAGGITLLSLRQDAGFGKAEGPMARRGWSGPLAQAPAHFAAGSVARQSRERTQRRHDSASDSGEQTFTLRF
jgi:hypothetical protein